MSILGEGHALCLLEGRGLPYVAKFATCSYCCFFSNDGPLEPNPYILSMWYYYYYYHSSVGLCRALSYYYHFLTQRYINKSDPSQASWWFTCLLLVWMSDYYSITTFWISQVVVDLHAWFLRYHTSLAEIAYFIVTLVCAIKSTAPPLAPPTRQEQTCDTNISGTHTIMQHKHPSCCKRKPRQIKAPHSYSFNLSSQSIGQSVFQ